MVVSASQFCGSSLSAVISQIWMQVKQICLCLSSVSPHCIHLILLQATRQQVKDTVEPMLADYKPSIAKEMKFKKFELGNVPRVLGRKFH